VDGGAPGRAEGVGGFGGGVPASGGGPRMARRRGGAVARSLRGSAMAPGRWGAAAWWHGGAVARRFEWRERRKNESARGRWWL
jgi:hypothetical protein